MSLTSAARRTALWIVLALVAVAYAPGLGGGYLFDDYPNIVDNPGLQIHDAHLTTLREAAFATDTSLLKRPLASLSFALNHLAFGLDPLPMKAVNLAIHLINVVLVYLIVLRLWRLAGGESRLARMIATLVAAAWALAPINLTAVLYVVQRMESLSHLFVLAGLLAYLEGRERQLAGRGAWGFVLGGLGGGTLLGLASKESAALLPLYATAIEWAMLRLNAADAGDRARLRWLHGAIIVAFLAGCLVLVPRYLEPSMWADRAFTLPQRLLTELRVLWSYVDWTLRPRLGRLGFYYDDYAISTGWLQPWTTALTAAAWLAVVAAAIAVRRRLPLASLGAAWFLLAHVLTATVFPLELVFEHRNYFASLGLLLVPATCFAALARRNALRRIVAVVAIAWIAWFGFTTTLRASEWGDPLRLAQSLAAKQPQSARTQYELGRTYLVLSNYDPASPFTDLATRTLERAAELPDASPLADQALLMQSQHLHRPDQLRWWTSLQDKLRRRKPGPQEISALYSLSQCTFDGSCRFAPERMVESYLAGLAHEPPSLELMAGYANFALNALGDSDLALRLTRDCVRRAPSNAQYRRNLVAVLVRAGRFDEARREFAALEAIEGSAAARAWAAASLPETAKIP